MNGYQCPTIGPLIAGMRRSTLLMWVALLAMAGCGGSQVDRPSVESRVSIENVGKWYQLYRANNAGKQPANEEAFLAFINGTLAERGQEAVDLGKLLSSPRDGELYVIRYGKVNSRDQDRNLVAYEKNGVHGMRLIVSELARSRIVDESELQSLLSSK